MEKIINEIRNDLINNSDKSYQEFSSKLIPTINSNKILGVRTPKLKELAKKYINYKDIDIFLNDLPHQYFEENQLHAFIISLFRDYDKVINYLNKFLPYIDNWATCDQLCPNIFKKHKEELIIEIYNWLKKDGYVVRFGIKMLMALYLDSDFKIIYPEIISKIKTDDYYINMMIAWYFATALAKQYDSIIPFFENKLLDTWINNKAISKASDSLKIRKNKEQFDYIRKFRR